MAAPRLSPPAYRRATAAALALLSAIVVTGAAVRLTGSGLGCSDWPSCEDDRLVAPLELHPMIEFTNRLFTGAVTIAIVVAVLGALVREPRRRDLTRLSLGLVAGVIAQIILGGISVKTHLHPAAIASHFLLSMVLVTNAVVLHWRAGQVDGVAVPAASARTRLLVDLLVVTGAAVLVAGTVVTGTGPHGGDEEARRFAFFMPDVARIHGAAVIALVGLTIAAAVSLHRSGAAPKAARAATALLLIEVAQAAVGYVQYFNGVPVGLVAVHIVGALAVWIGVVRLRLSTWERIAVAPGAAGPPPEPVLVPA